jgi:sugar phosphate permease
MQRSPQRRGIFFGWYIVAGSVLNNSLTSAAYFQGFQAFFLPILATFGWSRTALSGAFSLRQVESGVLTPFVGLLVDRWGARKLIVWGSVITGFGLMGLSQIQSLPMFYGFFLLTSIGTAGTSHGVTWAVLISRWFRRRRGRAMGIATLGPLVGGLFIVGNAVMVDHLGWRAVIFCYGLASVMAGPALGWFARPSPEGYGLLPDGEVVEEDADGSPRKRAAVSSGETGLDMRAIFRTRDFWVLTAFVAGVFMGTSAFGAHQIPYFVSKGFTAEGAAVTVLIASVASGVGRIGAGTLIDYLDYRLVLAAVTLLLSLSFLYLAVVPVTSFISTVPFTLVFGLGWGSSVPIRPLIGAMVFGTRSIGTVVGLMHLGSLAGGIAGPLIMGIVFDASGSYDSAIWVLGAGSVVVLPLLLLLRSRSQLPISSAPIAQRPMA